jgi:bifunctional non-homologous end joining protein LigD
MSLEQYRRKRHFQRTPEPKGKQPRAPGAHYVIQKHAARRLHYDFRLEMDGVLKSWAVPKGPSLDPSVKALAVHVEDHPIEYALFEGIIPEGEYGAGTVMVWDQGTWRPEGDARRGYRDGRLAFELFGEKLRGHWSLVRLKPKPGEDADNWLLIKRKDNASRGRGDPAVVDAYPNSVVTGRDLEQIASDADRSWTRNGEEKTRARTRSLKTSKTAIADAAPNPAKLPGARKAKMPAELQPQLATLVREAPRSDEWIFELKFDGYRLLSHIRNGRVELRTRAGNDWTSRFPTLADAAKLLPVRTAILDGEVVVLARDGTTDFQALQNLMRRGRDEDVVYYVFDLPYCDGYDLTAVPLIERKALLKALIASAKLPNRVIRYSDHIEGDGADVLSLACRSAVEGVIAKRIDSVYESRRSAAWVKLKCLKRQEFVIGGWTDPSGRRSGIGSLLLGYYQRADLIYCGRVGTGFTEQSLTDLRERLDKLTTDRSPFLNSPKGHDAKGVHWVRPALVAEVEFGSWTDDGIVRHSSFHGLREDRAPRAVRREVALQRAAGARTRSTGAADLPREVEREAPPSRLEIRLTHPDRVLYPENGITKRDLAQYYAAVADWILPHVVQRPLAIVRCPEGREGQCFFQKHVTSSMPNGVRGIDVQEHGKREMCLAIDDAAGLVGLAQMGCLEIHPWGSREDDLDLPDRFILDLDPGDGVPWRELVHAAREVRDRLESAGLQSFPRTTGGKGLHLVVPIQRGPRWHELKQAAQSFALALERRDSRRFIATSSKVKRAGRIYIDYLRNERGATAIASYSTRARFGAPVATPIRWNELTPNLDPNEFNVETVSRRLFRLKSDPWESFFTVKQSMIRSVIDSLVDAGHSSRRRLRAHAVALRR